MPIVAACKACGGKFSAPDHLAGKRVKCPKCAAAVAIPSRGQAAAPNAQAQSTGQRSAASGEWFAEASDGSKYGPLSLQQLRELVTAGKLDEFSRVRKQGTDDWKWLEDAFPRNRHKNRSKSAPKPADDVAAGERLSPCPDCSAMISRRAPQCPQCGCPIPPAATDQRAPLAAGTSAADAPKHKGALVAAGIVVALVVISIPAFIFAQYWINSRKQPPPPQPVAAAPAPKVTAEQKRQWIEEVAATSAKDLDDLYRRVHSATALMERATEGIKLMQTLAETGTFPDAASEAAAPKPAQPKPAQPKPYQSQYDALYKQCADHLAANLPQGDFDRAKVAEVAESWAAAKRAPLEKKLQEQVEQQIFIQ